jgi:hypothetical protein
VIEEHVDRDAIQPSIKRRLSAKARQIAEDAQEHFLREIFDVRGRHVELCEDAPHVRVVGDHELIERLVTPALVGFDQLQDTAFTAGSPSEG